MSEASVKGNGFSGIQVFLMIIAAILLTVGITSWVLFTDIFATEFKPVTLTSQEEQVLDQKLSQLGVQSKTSDTQVNTPLTPEAYNEADAHRVVVFSEKEVNGILAKNTDLANKVAIDLSDDLMSAKVLIPLDEEMPFLGGKTLKVTAGLGLSYVENKPVVIIKGVSIWGVPVPSAYMGELKNVDLVKQFGDSGFWKSFADGLEDLNVEEGTIVIVVKP